MENWNLYFRAGFAKAGFASTLLFTLLLSVQPLFAEESSANAKPADEEKTATQEKQAEAKQSEAKQSEEKQSSDKLPGEKKSGEKQIEESQARNSEQNIEDQIKELLFKALVSESLSSPEGAKASYEQALKLAQGSEPARRNFLICRVLLRLATFYFVRQKYSEAARYFELAKAHDRLDENQEIMLASSIYLSGKTDEGLKALSQIYESELKKEEAARSRYQSSSAQRSELAALYLKNKRIEDAAGLFEKATEDLQKSLNETKQELADLNWELVSKYKEAGFFDNAIAQLKKMLVQSESAGGKLDPESCKITRELASIYLKQGKKDQAEAVIGSMLEAARDDADRVAALAQSACFHFDIGEFARAKNELKEAIKIAQDQKILDQDELLVLKENLLVVLNANGDKVAAEQTEKELKELRKSLIPQDLRDQLGDSDSLYFELLSQKKIKEAIELCKAQEEKFAGFGAPNSDQVTWLQRWGLALEENGDFEAAVKVFEKAFALEQKHHRHSNTRFSLAKALVRSGHFDKARALYKVPATVSSIDAFQAESLDNKVHSYLSNLLAAVSMTNEFAIVCFETGNYKESEGLMLEVISNLEKKGLENSISGIIAYENLALINIKQTRMKEAQRILNELYSKQLKEDLSQPIVSNPLPGFSVSINHTFSQGTSAYQDRPYKKGDGKLRAVPLILAKISSLTESANGQIRELRLYHLNKFDSDWEQLKNRADYLLSLTDHKVAKSSEAKSDAAFPKVMEKKTRKESH